MCVTTGYIFVVEKYTQEVLKDNYLIGIIQIAILVLHGRSCQYQYRNLDDAYELS